MRIIQSDNPRPLNLLAVGPGGLVAAASSTFGAGGGVEVWDAASADRVFDHTTLATLGNALALAFTPFGHYLLVSDAETVAVLDTAKGTWVRNPLLSDWRPRLALAASGTRLLAGSDLRADGELECLSIDAELNIRSLWTTARGFESVMDAFDISRDARRVALVKQFDFTGRPARTLAVLDAESGKQFTRVSLDPANPVWQLAFTADGSKLLVRTDSRTVQLFAAGNGAAAGELVHPGRPYVTGVAVHPRGPVACTRTNGTVTFWDADTHRQLHTLDWKVGRLVSVAFSTDGALAAAGTEDGKIVVWDVDA